MKTRNGFVSNSSSSSFIIDADNNVFPTIKDVALYIMKKCYDDWSGYNFSNEIKVLESIEDPNSPIFFNTGGDETYIRKYGDKVIIRTTQNTEFDKITDIALGIDDLTDDFYKYFNQLC